MKHFILLGLVYALGRKDYGRLGLGEGADLQDTAVPTLIPGLQSTRCSGIACGTAVSYAIGENGLYLSVSFLNIAKGFYGSIYYGGIFC